MDILCISKKTFLLMPLFLIGCIQEEKKPNIPAYHFNEYIDIIGFDSISIKESKIILKKTDKNDVIGKVKYFNYGSDIAHIYFESIYDTITPCDTVIFSISDKDFYFTEIQQMYNTDKRPIFIQYKINGNYFRTGQGVIYK